MRLSSDNISRSVIPEPIHAIRNQQERNEKGRRTGEYRKKKGGSSSADSDAQRSSISPPPRAQKQRVGVW